MTTVGRGAEANPPILNCPHCYPPRPMVIKTVICSLRRVQTIVFTCTECGASLEMPKPSNHPKPSKPEVAA